MGNGCGPSWLPRWLKSLLFDWFHEASCAKHDEGYEKGGAEADRLRCDQKFLEAMLIDTLAQPWWIRPYYGIQAYLFYAIVRVFGWVQFNYEKNN
jgi:hypothetical protein